MTFLDELRAATSSPEAEWNVFIIEYAPDRKRVFVFHEGRDDPAFYRTHVEANLPKEYELRFVRSGNKAQVLARVEEFKSRFAANPRVLFFVDKDHDDLIQRAMPTYQWLYVTDSYSIESFLCSPEIVRRWLVDVGGMFDMDTRCKRIADRYEAARAVYVGLMLPVMAWVLAARKLGYKLNLNNVDVGQFVALDADLQPQLTQDGVTVFEYLEKVTGGSAPNAPIPAHLVTEAENVLGAVQPNRWLRGKQDAWFLVRYIESVSEELRNAGSPLKVRISLNTGNVIHALGPRAPVPSCLATFLAAVSGALMNPAGV